MVNGPLLEKIAAQIEETPHLWRQDSYKTYVRNGEEMLTFTNECETAYCIAGWAVFLTEGEKANTHGYFVEGMNALELESHEAQALFHGGMGSPHPCSPGEMAEVLRAIARGVPVDEALPEGWYDQPDRYQ